MNNLADSDILATLLENFPASISIHDKEYRIVWENKASRTLRGMSLKEMEGLKCHTLKGRCNPCADCPMVEVLKTGEPQEGEVLGDTALPPTAPHNSWCVKASPIRDFQGEIIGTISIAQDITEYRETEYQLKKEKAFVSDILEASQDLIWAIDLEERLTYSNSALEGILGYNSSDLSGRKICEFMHPDDLAKVRKGLPRLVESREGWRNKIFRWRHKKGNWKEMESSGFPTLDSEGMVNGFRGIDRDVTDRQHLASQLLHSQKMEAVGRLAGGIAHDFNNMIGVILGYSEMALDQMNPSEDLQEALSEIKRAANKSADLTRQLLAFARKQKIEPRVIDLNETVESMLKMLKRLIGEEIELEWLPGKSLWKVEMDPGQIDQVLANLCVNARDAIDGRGRITIRTSNAEISKSASSRYQGLAPGNYVVLEVSDTGQGISEEIIDNIFEPFFTTKPKGAGTGLGLPIVYGIVKQNQGFIYALSEPGRSTTFRIFLPRCELLP